MVGDIGAVVIKPLRGLQGDVTRLLHAAAFRDNLSSCPTGRYLLSCPPELRERESGGHGELVELD